MFFCFFFNGVTNTFVFVLLFCCFVVLVSVPIIASGLHLFDLAGRLLEAQHQHCNQILLKILTFETQVRQNGDKKEISNVIQLLERYRAAIPQIDQALEVNLLLCSLRATPTNDAALKSLFLTLILVAIELYFG